MGTIITNRMKKLLLILLCLPFTIFGQGWEKTFGGTNDDFDLTLLGAYVGRVSVNKILGNYRDAAADSRRAREILNSYKE